MALIFGIFDWFWELPLMQTLQGWVDAGRASAPEPLILISGALVVGMLIIWRMAGSAVERDQKIMGGHYKGKLTPKSLNRKAKADKARDMVLYKRRQLRGGKPMDRPGRRR